MGKRELIGDVDNITSYSVLHNSTNVLCRGLPGLSVGENVRLIGEQAKSHVHRYLKMISEGVNPAFHAWVIIERVMVEVAELKDVSF